MTLTTKTFSKSISLLLGLTMIAALVACGGGSSSTTVPPTSPPTIAITATSGTPQSATVGAAFSAPLVATVTSNGSAASGVSVTFTAPSSGQSGTFASNGKATETDTTNSSGVATSSVFTANTTPGAYSVTAAATGAATPASFSLSNSAGAPAIITATSGSGQSTNVSTQFTNPLVATVTDADNNPLSGVAVTFTAPSTGASGAFATSGTSTETDMTGSNGEATSSLFTANATAGSNYTVAASVSGVATPADFTLTNVAVGPVVLITATGGNNQTATVGKKFAQKLQATVTSNGVAASGASVTFTAPSTGASGTFTNGTDTETDTTDSSGVATSSNFTANVIAGTYTVAATTAGAAAPANFTETNSAPAGTLTPGNYVFSLSGTDANGFYTVSGAFTVGSSGATITGGELAFSDSTTFDHDSIASGTVALNSKDTNLLITLTTCTGTNCTLPDPKVGVSGVETLDAALVTSSKFLLTEFDTSATSSGELDSQASIAAPSGSYAFFVNGLASNGTSQLSIGGVLDIASAGTISTTGSVFDLSHQSGVVLPDETFSAGTVTTPTLFGYVTFALTPSDTSIPEFSLSGYIIDANHIRLVESTDVLAGTTGGTALGQGTNTGTFSTSSISGSSYVVGAAGMDTSALGDVQVVGLLTFNSDLSVSGQLNFNDIAAQSPQGGSTITGGSYTVDPTGRVTVTGITDAGPTFDYNLQLYLTGSGSATVTSQDTSDVMGGYAFQQTGTLNAASFTGGYVADLRQVLTTGDEQDGVGSISANGVSSLAGFLDVNETFKPKSNLSLSGTFATGTVNGILTGTIKDAVSGAPNSFTYYMVSGSQALAIEDDNVELTLGVFENQ